MERKIYKMKKVLFATVAAVMSTTAAMADVSISEYQQGKTHALMQAANSFEARGINIVENSNKIAVHKTVNAWNQGWNALEGENTVDLDASVMVTTLYTTTHGVITTESDNIVISDDLSTATVSTGAGISYEIDAADVQAYITQSVSLRDSRADIVSVQASSSATEVAISGEVAVRVEGNESFDRLIDKVEAGVQKAYDSGFEDGYTAGYDDGFAAAKGVVKN